MQVLQKLTGKKRSPEFFYATIHSVQIGFVSREQPEIKWLPHVFQLTAVERNLLFEKRNMAAACKTLNRLGSQLPCWVHWRVICWRLEPGLPSPLILHKYLLLIQTLSTLSRLIEWLLSDVLPSPKTKIFLRYWFSGNQFFYTESKFIFASGVVWSSLLVHYRGIVSVSETI